MLGDPERGIVGIAKIDEGGVTTLIPPIPEDTGLRTNNITYYVVNATCEIRVNVGEDEREIIKKLLAETGNDMFRIFVYTVEELDEHLIELMAKQKPDQNRGFTEAISIAAWTLFHFYRTHRDRIIAASQ